MGSNQRMRFKPALIFLFSLLTLLLLFPGCSKGSGSVAVNVAKPSTDTLYNDSYTAPQADIKAGNKSVIDVSNAIQAKDTKAFTALMSTELLNKFKGAPDLTSPAAISLAEGLKTARIIKAEQDCFVYETKVNGTDITFLMIKENGVWKISGL